jgi:hypothetical protein
MKYLLILLSLTCLSGSVQSQDEKIRVLLVGTFHFAQDTIFGAMTPKRQAEITELCQKLAEFNPDKIFIERNPEFEYVNRVDTLYRSYLNGKWELRANEIYQIAFRLGKMLGHNTMYQCDHPGMYGYYYSIIYDYAEANGQLPILEAETKGTTKSMYITTNDDSLLQNSALTEYLQWINSEEHMSKSHAYYINVFPQTGNTHIFTTNYDSTYFAGVKLLTDWYRRNLMIYAKMLAQLDYTEKRIFLIMGSDHIPIIRELFSANPYFTVEDTNEWLK